MKHAVLVGLLLILCTGISTASVDEGIAAIKRGDYEAAYAEFSELAEAGDSRAMITIGVWYYQGNGFAQDYGKAMDWFLQAFELKDGDAYNNIGVMYRDGLGVPRNRQIAYSLFLITHMRSLGSQSTQLRANRNLRREVAELSRTDIAAALCLSEEYVSAYVKSRGHTSVDAFDADRQYVALKDKDWWLPGEIADFDCAP